MSHWWEHGPESNPDKADSCCTSVTSEHMNTLLGNILKIIYNNLGIDEGAWMKRLAGKHDNMSVCLSLKVRLYALFLKATFCLSLMSLHMLTIRNSGHDLTQRLNV